MSSFARTSDLLRQDRARLRDTLAARPEFALCLPLNPAYQAAWLYRWARHFHCRGNRLMARFLWHLNCTLTGADISLVSEIGGGLVLECPLAVTLVCKAGRNLTVRAHVGVGGGVSHRDAGAGPGLPLVGDGVMLDIGCLVLGPVRVGDGAWVGAKSLVLVDVEAGARVEPGSVVLRKETRHNAPEPGANGA